jgi:hypothetical protein
MLFAPLNCQEAVVNHAEAAWPKADIPAHPLFCRYWGKSRHRASLPPAGSIYEYTPSPGQNPIITLYVIYQAEPPIRALSYSGNSFSFDIGNSAR